MNKIKLSLLLGVMALAPALVGAQNVEAVKQKLLENFPKVQYEKITYIPDIKLYEVIIKNNDGQKVPTYTNDSLDFLMLTTGELISTKTKQNVTLEREVVRTKEVFNALPFKETFFVKYGNGQRKVAIFSDPDCPFCQQMEKEIANELKKENVTVYYFMNPLKSLHPQADERAKRIMCSSNPSQAWLRYTTSAPGLDRNAQSSWNPEAALPKNSASCSKAALVDKHHAMSQGFGFNSTPTIMFDNGYIVRDRLNAQQLMSVLNRRKP